MKKIILIPEEIIVADYELDDVDTLQKYFDIFYTNQGKNLPPLIVINKNFDSGKIRKEYSKYPKEIDSFYSKLENLNANYLLIDGSHRGLAATLCEQTHPSLILETEEDLDEVIAMAKKGAIPSGFFYDSDWKLPKIANSFLEHIFFRGFVGTLKQQKDNLILEDKITQSIKKYITN